MPERLGITNVPVVQKLYDLRITAAGKRVEGPELLRLLDEIARLGKDQDNLVAPLDRARSAGMESETPPS